MDWPGKQKLLKLARSTHFRGQPLHHLSREDLMAALAWCHDRHLSCLDRHKPRIEGMTALAEDEVLTL